MLEARGLLWAIPALFAIAQGFPACQGAATVPRESLAIAAADLPPPALYVASGGSDTSSGLDPDRPLRSLAAAAAKAGPGTTVHVRPGTYRERLVTRSGGGPGRPLVFKGESAVIDGSGQGGEAGRNQNEGLVELRHPHVKFAGFTVQHSRNSGIVLDADDLTVEDCEVAYTERHAIATDTGRQRAAGGAPIRNLTLSGNRVHDATRKGNGYGQPISIIADEFEIAGNELYQNHEIAIDVWLGSRHGKVHGNTVRDNPGQTAIYVDGASYIEISGNRIFRNRNGIGVSSEDGRYSTRHVWIHDNVIHDNPGDACFLWDRDVGAQDVLFAHNTLVRNGRAFRFAGRGNSARVVANLTASSGEPPVEDVSRESAIAVSGNVWLESLEGFVDAARGDFRLTGDSPALDRALPLLEALEDDLGRKIDLSRDADGRDRTADGRPDAGAYER